MGDPKSLAAEIEAAQIIFEAIYPHLRYEWQSPENRKPFERAAAALQSRAFDDGARIGLRDHRAVTLRRMHARAERMMQTAYRAGNATDGAIYREEVDALTWVLAALAPTTPEGRTE
ncbi:hypothetical protein [Methylobacterium sp. B4]|uniref:hypothetical protein n=1 Tax=Methylobacterium sp. B4 TaxID=1938755 RepID=UPI000D75CD12|nr:hypothetical protein [Methylobacterium sp. B4]PXW55591.1 hypothetical protein BY998_11875 [Methylobacterium sp. B4]